LIDAIPPIKRPSGGCRKRPDKAFADRAYDAEEKTWVPLRRRGSRPFIAKRNMEHEHLPRRLQPRAKEAFYNICMAGAREAAHTTFALLLEAYGPKHPMVRERMAQS
jgi:hypothetical protein